jgi:hypothetical protein
MQHPAPKYPKTVTLYVRKLDLFQPPIKLLIGQELGRGRNLGLRAIWQHLYG